MTDPQVRTTVEEAVSTPMMRPVTVTGDNKSWVLDPKGIVEVDVDAMVDRPTRRGATRRSSTGSSAISAGSRFPPTSTPSTRSTPRPSPRGSSQTAAQVNRKPVNAVRKPVKYAVRITPAVYGARVQEASADRSDLGGARRRDGTGIREPRRLAARRRPQAQGPRVELQDLHHRVAVEVPHLPVQGREAGQVLPVRSRPARLLRLLAATS